jgi:ABC-type multidrug transport system fused ATPase/permease subunit
MKSKEKHLSTSVISLLSQIWRFIDPKRRKQFWILLGAMCLSSLLDAFSLGATLPFLSALTAPEKLFNSAVAQPLINIFQLSSPSDIVLPITILFCVATIFSGAAKLFVLWFGTRLSFSLGSEISTEVYRRSLFQPYLKQISRNSSEVINAITTKVTATINAINMSFIFISSLIMLGSVLAVLVAIDPIITSYSLVGFGLIYFLIGFQARRRLKKYSKSIANESTLVLKSLREGFGAIREVLLDNNQEYYCKIYQKSNYPYHLAQGALIFIGQSPRFFIEILGIVLIAIIAYSMSIQENGLSNSIPILGVLAFGAQRILPILQQAYTSWAYIRGAENSIQDTLNLLNEPLPVQKKNVRNSRIKFKKQIALKNARFSFDGGRNLLFDGINLVIPKGSRIGFIGTTGSGKTTLVDIIMGLLLLKKGSVEIDGIPLTKKNLHSWQKLISHVPQAIYLTDGSIEENIAFGVAKDQIDRLKVIKVASQVCLSNLIESWPNNYETLVGERGARLSGGQRQRIGIARALYKNAEIIVLDEATSALDQKTERDVMQAIDNLDSNKTILIISHRISTLKKCTHIVKILDNHTLVIDSYKNMFGKVNLS